MRSDKELLELAAKAAGIPLRQDHDGSDYYHFDLGNGSYKHWEPLKDDGDILRLSTLLHIDITRYPSSKEVGAARMRHNGVCEALEFRVFIKYSSDPYQATRIAVLNVAAEIGASL